VFLQLQCSTKQEPGNMLDFISLTYRQSPSMTRGEKNSKTTFEQGVRPRFCQPISTRTSTLSFALEARPGSNFCSAKTLCGPPPQSYFFRRKRMNSITVASIVPTATSMNVPIFEVPNDGEVLDDCSSFFSLLKEVGSNRFNGAPVDLPDFPLPSEVALPCPLSPTPSGRSSL